MKKLIYLSLTFMIITFSQNTNCMHFHGSLKKIKTIFLEKHKKETNFAPVKVVKRYKKRKIHKSISRIDNALNIKGMCISPVYTPSPSSLNRIKRIKRRKRQPSIILEKPKEEIQIINPIKIKTIESLKKTFKHSSSFNNLGHTVRNRKRSNSFNKKKNPINFFTISPKKIKRIQTIQKLSKRIQTDDNSIQLKSKIESLKKYYKKIKKISLDDIDIDYTIYTRDKDKKKIVGVNGAIIFLDLRSFTLFCNNCKKDEEPAFFMSDLTDIIEKIVKKWKGNIIGIAGDGYVILFPKKKSEKSFTQSIINSILCATELICESLQFMKNETTKYYPKKFDLGIEIGQTCFYKLNAFKKLVPISGVSNTINNAARYQEHSKKSKHRKITISERMYTFIKNNNTRVTKQIATLFASKKVLHERGVKIGSVRSCSLKKLKLFYKTKEWKKYKKRKRKFEYTLFDLMNIIKNS